MTSYQTMKTSEFDDAIYYRLGCECSDSRCDLTLEFEIDKNIPNFIFLNLYKDLSWSSYWQDYKWYQRWWRKIKVIFRLIFIGYISLEETFVIRGEDHIDSIINTLIEGKEKMKGKQNEVQKGNVCSYSNEAR